MGVCKNCNKENKNSNPNFCSMVCDNSYRKKIYSEIRKIKTILNQKQKELKSLRYRKLLLDEKEINFRYKFGENISSIARVFGVDRETIERRIKNE